ncbi:MAG: response regulator [Chitinispirillaceae bacterium]|nr:response regulator [Chitinispirillaceae bacterium]
MKKYSILVVDDDQNVCKIMKDLFQTKDYETYLAHNGREALEIISKKPLDLVISDIQMPEMDGFELFQILEKEYPHIRRIMMTSYEINHYLKIIRKYNIGNILVKGFEFNIKEVLSYVESILSGDIFGLERHFPGVPLNEITVYSYAQAKEIYKEIIRSSPEKESFFLELAIDELISNAIFHGILQLSNAPREKWAENIILDKESPVIVRWGVDKEKIGISIEDPKGRLRKNDVLKWLDIHDRKEDEGEHGRGLFLVRSVIDRLIINIAPGKKTECIIFQYFNKKVRSYNKPLLIHEV